MMGDGLKALRRVMDSMDLKMLKASWVHLGSVLLMYVNGILMVLSAIFLHGTSSFSCFHMQLEGSKRPDDASVCMSSRAAAAGFSE